jgi:hypothetical protein
MDDRSVCWLTPLEVNLASLQGWYDAQLLNNIDPRSSRSSDPDYAMLARSALAISMLGAVTAIL